MCTSSGGSVWHEPETQGYLALGYLYESLNLHAQFPISRCCNLCHSGIMLDYLSRPKLWFRDEAYCVVHTVVWWVQNTNLWFRDEAYCVVRTVVWWLQNTNLWFIDEAYCVLHTVVWWLQNTNLWFRDEAYCLVHTVVWWLQNTKLDLCFLMGQILCVNSYANTSFITTEKKFITHLKNS